MSRGVKRGQCGPLHPAFKHGKSKTKEYKREYDRHYQTPTTRLCQHCGRLFRGRNICPSTLRIGKFKFCSRVCADIGRKRAHGAENHFFKDGRASAPGYVRARQNQRRTAEGEFTPADIAALLIRQRKRCIYCRVKLPPFHIDHIVAVTCGGSNWPANLQLLCPRCNIRKNAKPAAVFARTMGWLF